jgi:uncharacterized protein YegL
MELIGLEKRLLGLAATLLLGLLLSVCNSSPGTVVGQSAVGVGEGGAAGGAGAGGGTGPLSQPLIDLDASVVSGNGGTGGAPAAPTSDANCGMQTSSTIKQPTDVLLVLDRSGSMSFDIAEDCCCSTTCTSSTGMSMCSNRTNCTPRWPALTSAIDTTMTQATGIEWGLKLFSSQTQTGRRQTDGCAVNPGVEVGIGSGSTSAVQTQIANVSADGGTPTANAITTATSYLQTVNDPNAKVILLATDGEPNCKVGARDTTTSDVDGATTAIQAALAAGFKVYVIGIGPSVGDLDNFAKAGGTDHYYPATSASDLVSALAAISKAVASCTFAMSQTPPDPSNMAVYLDGKLIANDPANGWSFGATSQTVMLNGSACNAITSGAASKVQVLFGCAGQAPPDQIIALNTTPGPFRPTPAR